VDLNDKQMRDMIVEIEDRRAEAHGQRLLWVAVGIGVMTGLGALVLIPGLIMAIPLPVPFANPIKFIGLMILTGLAMSKALVFCFPAHRRFPELVAGRGGVRLPSNLRGVQRSTWITIAAVIGVGVVASVAVPLVSAYVEREEAEHRVQQASAFEALRDCVDGDGSGERTRDCQPALEALRAAVDDRSADMALRLTLDDKLSCATGCDATKLEEHMSDLRNIAIDRMLTGAAPFRRSSRSAFLAD
jgi:hypothetical protein